MSIHSQDSRLIQNSIHDSTIHDSTTHDSTMHDSQTALRRVLDGAWSAHNVLTNDETTQLRNDALSSNMKHVEKQETTTTDARLRDCTRCTLERPDLAERIFKRLLPHLEPEVHVDGSEACRLRGLPAGDEELHGVWRPCGVNPVIRVCCYPGDGRGHFGPHQDAAVEFSRHERSLLTLNGSLATLPEKVGGCTRFLVDELPIYKDERGRFTVEHPEDVVLGAIRPEVGVAATFFHGLMHDSEPLLEGAPPKWIWRSEVMYRRDPASAPQLDRGAELARAIDRVAEKMERTDAMQSMRMFKLSQRLRDGRISVDAAATQFEALRPAGRRDGGESSETDTEYDVN
jgi:hypothetical protein